MTPFRTLSVLGLLALCQVAGAAELQSYDSGQWQTLRQAHASHPWIAHFWGMSCAPCRQELPAWGRFMHDHPDAQVTFIEVEQAAPASVEAVLTQAGLDSGDQWLSANGFDVAERYAVDRHWGGEIPITLLISSNGQAQKMTGGVDFVRLGAWADANKP